MSNQLRAIEELKNLSSIKIQSWRGREAHADGRRYVDYANTNYLGFDFDPALHAAGSAEFDRWGAISGWSRLEIDPEVYSHLEVRISNFIGCSQVQLSHTITVTAFSLVPAIAQKGLIVTDRQVHRVIWESCRLARDHGAKLLRFQHQDIGDLERILDEHQDIHPKLVAVDGVYSISAKIAPILELQKLARRYNAWLLVDDAHGFGILGENPTIANPYGVSGNGVIRYHGGDFSRTFYLSSFGKAFCTYSAFITIPEEFREEVNTLSLQYIFSAPPNPYMVGTVQAALDLNDKYGEIQRAKLRGLVKTFTDGLSAIGCTFLVEALQPIVYVQVGNLQRLIEVATKLWASGIIAGLRAYPLVPPEHCGLRFAITALHTTEQIQEALYGLEKALE